MNKSATVTGRPSSEELSLLNLGIVIVTITAGASYLFKDPNTSGSLMFALSILAAALGITSDLLGERYGEATCSMFLTAFMAVLAALMFVLSGKDYAVLAGVVFLFATSLAILGYLNQRTRFPKPPLA